ncbi:hypothetical protein H5410_010754 [Solanum commersonii]|uniref:Uncharacterized protein n=1 Tax=Solanum commersonii TaxID=4109 RepID=A0A9J6ALK5_SOLCO|nr:hypothetical protein H5410_010754 [Solanum commersonii]
MFHQVVVRPTLLYGAQCLSVKNDHVQKMNVRVEVHTGCSVTDNWINFLFGIMGKIGKKLYKLAKAMERRARDVHQGRGRRSIGLGDTH